MIGKATLVVIVLWTDKRRGWELFMLDPKKGALDIKQKILGFNLSFSTFIFTTWKQIT